MTNPYQFAQENRDRFLEEYLHILRIPSVSTQAEHAKDVILAAEWLKAMMLNIGMDSAEIILMPEGRCPLVLGEWKGAGEDRPTVLIYCHYDVQPAAMEDGWDTKPFEPTFIDDRLFARGAVDSKLHVMCQLKAVESLLAQAEKPTVNIKVVLEGEEESGSENINAFIAKHPERLKADVAVVSDGTILRQNQPSMVYGLRGLTSMELRVSAPQTDLHSGHWGGTVHNPIQALAEIIAKLHDVDGRVTVPGFYDDVLDLTEQEHSILAEIEPHIKAEWDSVVNAPKIHGEAGFNLPELIGARPTLEINGIRGGYAGDGFKTVLPGYALAKISCRLVPNQDPQDIADKVSNYIKEISPSTVNTEVKLLETGAPAILIDLNSKAMKAARSAYTFAWDKEPMFARAGGTIPISHEFLKVAQEVVIMGYGLKSGRAHGPNENIYLDSFYKGINSAIKFIEEIGNQHG